MDKVPCAGRRSGKTAFTAVVGCRSIFNMATTALGREGKGERPGKVVSNDLLGFLPQPRKNQQAEEGCGK